MAKRPTGNLPIAVKTTQSLFDLHPMEIGKFMLRARSATAVGNPTREQWATAYDFATNTEEASPYWLGDLINYAQGRPDWQDFVDQEKNKSGKDEQTLYNLAHISRRTGPRVRELAKTIGHAAVVAPMQSENEQVEWVKRARTEGWTVGEFRKQVRAASRTKIIEGQAVLEGMYRIIYADPPWLYGDSGATVDGSLGKAERHFPGMTIKELCDLPVQAHALPNAILFCWVTAPMLYENPGPREVIEAWGFKPKTGRVWDKVLGMPTHYALQGCHEHLIIATRGSCLPDVPTPHDKSIFVERRGEEHSGKPESVRQWIEKRWTSGPYLELFGRRPVEGWSVFGNDARLWAEDAKRTA